MPASGPNPVIALRDHPNVTDRASTAGDATAVAVAALIETALAAKGITTTGDMDAAIKKAAAKVPSWVIYLAVLLGGPSLGAFYVTAQSIYHLPDKVEVILKAQEGMQVAQKSQGEFLARQGEQLVRIEATLRLPPVASSRPIYYSPASNNSMMPSSMP